METGRYFYKITLKTPLEETVARVKEALAAEGFGILTEIDVKATLKKKLDVDFRPYIILGACNPPLAYRTLQAEEQIGLLLPCNVVVQELDGMSVVSAIDPEKAMMVMGNDQLEPVASEVSAKLRKVMVALQGS